MKKISSTDARRHIKDLIDDVADTGEAVVIERRGKEEVVVIRFPDTFSKDANQITNINAYSQSFDFLTKEPDLYSRDDLKRSYE